MERKRRPWIGFLGLVGLLVGCGMIGTDAYLFGIGMVAAGTIVLVWALMTGNLKLFG